MSARYGSRTRSGEAVSDLGRRATGGAGGAWVMTEERFTAPGTWTCPATTTSVEVIVVGGGGGGGGVFTSAPYPAGGGGGGGVRTAIVPVSGPVPITVGAGGTGFSPAPLATPGGISYFGPAGPGPVPAIPATTIAAGGGGAGSSYNPGSTPLLPPIGGGGGGLSPYTYDPVAVTSFKGGLYGYSSVATGSSPLTANRSIGAGGAGSSNLKDRGGRGKFGFGGGAPSRAGLSGQDGAGTPSFVFGSSQVATAGEANTGGGGGAGGWPSPNPLAGAGAPGGSGIVIVRWWGAP